MTRDNTLIQDPNSLFAISRALRKRIVETDPNPEHRNDAIRDEKHIAYKSQGKAGIETFKYDILTSLEQLDNMFLELETVVPKITNDPAKPRGRPKKGAGLVGGKRCCFNSAYCNGTAHYRNPRMTGGALPDLPSDPTILLNLNRSLNTVGELSRTLKKLLRSFLPQVERALERYQQGALTNNELIDILDSAFQTLDQKDVDKLAGDESDAMTDIYDALTGWFETLPLNAPESLAEPLVAPKKRVITVSATAGNEFVVSTLSKINILLIKLIAEYNGKILPNYKKFLQSDLEEIANKVADSQRRFRELKDDYLERFSEGAKASNTDKFVDTIDKNFNKFTGLVSRSIANFVNPNLIFLPNFSQQLIGTYADPKESFNLQQTTEERKDFVYKVKRLAKEYTKLEEKLLKTRDEAFYPAQEKKDKIMTILSKYYAKRDKRPLTTKEEANIVIYERQVRTLSSVLDKSVEKMEEYRASLDDIEALPEYAFFGAV